MKPLPCPWCKSGAWPNGHVWVQVQCNKCWASGPCKTTDQSAIRAWNRVAKAMQKRKIK